MKFGVRSWEFGVGEIPIESLCYNFLMRNWAWLLVVVIAGFAYSVIYEVIDLLFGIDKWLVKGAILAHSEWVRSLWLNGRDIGWGIWLIGCVALGLYLSRKFSKNKFDNAPPDEPPSLLTCSKGHPISLTEKTIERNDEKLMHIRCPVCQELIQMPLEQLYKKINNPESNY
jgi:hypothetical protein